MDGRSTAFGPRLGGTTSPRNARGLRRPSSVQCLVRKRVAPSVPECLVERVVPLSVCVLWALGSSLKRASALAAVSSGPRVPGAASAEVLRRRQEPSHISSEDCGAHLLIHISLALRDPGRALFAKHISRDMLHRQRDLAVYGQRPLFTQHTPMRVPIHRPVASGARATVGPAAPTRGAAVVCGRALAAGDHAQHTAQPGAVPHAPRGGRLCAHGPARPCVAPFRRACRIAAWDHCPRGDLST
jgi:hypothetical protein